MEIRAFQKKIEDLYFEKDALRGADATFGWFVEEVGELARALRKGGPDQKREEFADVLAWLATLASLHAIDLEASATVRYGSGCPHCGASPCSCPEPRSRP
ncbi:MAG: MazG nucleotide pyrophosphohydrolase domain-containing protein [Planctomycetota bacterium]|jgi:NTP pyrophosphatase (non-canonical NTP hydrolase)